MVPGSTLMYGSNFIRVTEKPRASRMAPTEEAAPPLPREATPPPVMKMNLVAMRSPCSGRLIPSRAFVCRQDPLDPVQIVRRVHPDRSPADDQDPDGNAVLQGPELLQRLAALERRGRQAGQPQQGLPLVAVDAEVLQGRRASLLTGLPRIGDGRA